MKKFLFSFLFIFAMGAYALSRTSGGIAAGLFVEDDVTKVIAPNIPAAITTNTPLPTKTTAKTSPTPVPSPAPTPIPAPVPTGRYKDGSYTGTVADAYYGYVRVRATVSGGNLTDVTFLQYPSDRSTSREINAQAMPYLKQEALQAQSANVSGVSGATDTSMAFVQSLQSALAQAAV